MPDPNNVRPGDPAWVCIGYTCIAHGCVTNCLSCSPLDHCRPSSDPRHQPEDMRYGDYVGPGRFVPQAFAVTREATMNATDLEQILRRDLHALAGTFGTRAVDTFMRGAVTCHVHDTGSAFSTQARGTDTFQSARTDILTLIRRRLAPQAGACRATYQCEVEHRHMPWVTFPAWRSLVGGAGVVRGTIGRLTETRFPLGAVLGDTKGIKVFLRNLQVGPSRTQPGSTTFQFDLRIEVCDHFGADNGDHYTEGLRALWLLQHARPGPQRPFVNVIVTEERASITVP